MSKLRVFIAGGSGLIGVRLAQSLREDGHEPIILSRSADQVRRRREMWPFRIVPGDPTVPGAWQDEVDGCDAVVNLAGHNIFADRWTTEIKRKVRDSRVHSAEQLTAAIKQGASARRRLFTGRQSGITGRAVTKSWMSRVRRAPISWPWSVASARKRRPTWMEPACGG